MELRSHEDDSKEQSENPLRMYFSGHVVRKTELRPERLRGQAVCCDKAFISNHFCVTIVAGRASKAYGLCESAEYQIRAKIGATRSGAGGLRGDFVFRSRRLAPAPAYQRRGQCLPHLPSAAHAGAGGRFCRSSSRARGCYSLCVTAGACFSE